MFCPTQFQRYTTFENENKMQKGKKERNIDDDEGKQLKQDETCKILFCRVLNCFAEILKFVYRNNFFRFT
jgi:hypothetical protein